MHTLIVTGGAGFIGSEVVRQILARGDRVINLDALTYAGNLDNLRDIAGHAHYQFVHGSICDSALVAELLSKWNPDAILNLAAESHVDRSIDGPRVFFDTNVTGTLTLLECLRTHNANNAHNTIFVHISTDEVFGPVPKGYTDEYAPYRPSSPYAASKAGSDHLALSYHTTYGLPVMITNGSNTYGRNQFPEKLLPLHILNALEAKPLPIYGKGENVREWLHVSDHASGILAVCDHGVPGNTYNIGGGNERTNIEIITELCAILDDEAPRADGRPHNVGITHVTDRPGHDTRYALNSEKAHTQLNWHCRTNLSAGLRTTVRWYIDNIDWCRNITETSYDRRRLGGSAATS